MGYTTRAERTRVARACAGCPRSTTATATSIPQTTDAVTIAARSTHYIDDRAQLARYVARQADRVRRVRLSAASQWLGAAARRLVRALPCARVSRRRRRRAGLDSISPERRPRLLHLMSTAPTPRGPPRACPLGADDLRRGTNPLLGPGRGASRSTIPTAGFATIIDSSMRSTAPSSCRSSISPRAASSASACGRGARCSGLRRADGFFEWKFHSPEARAPSACGFLGLSRRRRAPRRRLRRGGQPGRRSWAPCKSSPTTAWAAFTSCR